MCRSMVAQIGADDLWRGRESLQLLASAPKDVMVFLGAAGPYRRMGVGGGLVALSLVEDALCRCCIGFVPMALMRRTRGGIVRHGWQLFRAASSLAAIWRQECRATRVAVRQSKSSSASLLPMPSRR